MEKIQYKTRQRDELLTYLQSVKGEHVTVSDVCSHFSKQGVKIGTTTVYRHLEKMMEEGLVKKYVLESNAPACFEYMDPTTDCLRQGCMHMKCTSCGKLIHLYCEDLIAVENHIQNKHQFKIDTQRTVFYGLCKNCQ